MKITLLFSEVVSQRPLTDGLFDDFFLSWYKMPILLFEVQ